MELVDFLRQTQQQVRDETVERGIEAGEAAFPELLFTEIVTRHMADIGMTLILKCVHTMPKLEVDSVQEL